MRRLVIVALVVLSGCFSITGAMVGHAKGGQRGARAGAAVGAALDVAIVREVVDGVERRRARRKLYFCHSSQGQRLQVRAPHSVRARELCEEALSARCLCESY